VTLETVSYTHLGTGTAVATLANYGSTVFDDLSTNEQLNSVDLSNDE